MAYSFENDKTGYVVNLSKLKTFSYEIGSIRPPSEGGSSSLLIRVTRNCPWNKCTFCYGFAYNRERFQLRSIEEIKADVNAAKAISNEIGVLSWKLGYAGKIEPLAEVLQNNLFNSYNLAIDSNLHCIVNVFNWLCSGGKTVFLQDADTLIMRTPQLLEVIDYLRETFPSIERITSYARAKTIYRKKSEELSQLRQAGLSRLHIGLETGDDDLLSYVNKGVTAEEHIAAGKKAIEAGFELSEYIMPGLGGRSKWVQHAQNTARVLNEINPHFIRSRPFVPKYNTPMFEAYRQGEFELSSQHERLREIKLMIENLQVTSRVCFDHSYNPSYRLGNRFIPLLKQDYSGYKFPEEKQVVLDLIIKGLEIDEKAFISASTMIGTLS
jgi:radical SAM superfamily enzyme YgiQ (UPF0313 family)